MPPEIARRAPVTTIIRRVVSVAILGLGACGGALVYDSQRVKWLIQANCSGTINFVTMTTNPCVPGPPNIEVAPDSFALFAYATVGLLLAAVLILTVQIAAKLGSRTESVSDE